MHCILRAHCTPQGVALRLCLARAPAISFGRERLPAAAARGSLGGDALRLEVLLLGLG